MPSPVAGPPDIALANVLFALPPTGTMPVGGGVTMTEDGTIGA